MNRSVNSLTPVVNRFWTARRELWTDLWTGLWTGSSRS